MSKILRTITGVPWFVTNSYMHRNSNVPIITDEMKKKVSRYVTKVLSHSNARGRRFRSKNKCGR